MNKIKVAFIVPSTSKNRNWKTVEESYLYKFLITSFKKTCSNNFVYKFFIGYDSDDEFYINQDNITFFKNQNINIEFFKLTIQKGHLTKMWNILGEIAFNEKYDFFYICGDDIIFRNNDWLELAIEKLVNNNYIGCSGPWSENTSVLTQCLVHKTHYKIFNFIYPQQLQNWGCDNWINDIYKPDNFFPLSNDLYFASNAGGIERYSFDINWQKKYYEIVDIDKKILNLYLQKDNI